MPFVNAKPFVPRHGHVVFSIFALIYCVTICGNSVVNGESQRATTGEKPSGPPPQPNIVWLISEDNSKHYLRHFDPDGAPAENIQRLAKKGITFDHAFSCGPVCSVARTTLITGCYAPRIGTQFHRRGQLAPMPEGLKMFPAYLRESGYYTTNNDKQDYNAIKTSDVWDESSRKASYRNRPHAETPFFHVQTFKDSHESRLHFTRQQMQATPNKTDEAELNLQPYFPDTPLFRYTRARYHDRIRIIDQQIGDFIQQLEADGLLESTFVFYFGDHGGVLPNSKGYTTEAGLHVPLIVRIPDRYRTMVAMPVDSRVKGFVQFIDFAPTTLALAGVDVPNQMDGSPFLGNEIDAETLAQRQTALGHADRFDEKYDLVRTWRKGRFKYVRNYEAFYPPSLQNNYRYLQLAYQQWRQLHEQGKLNAEQNQFFQPKPIQALFDLKHDPHEVNNLAGNPQYAETLKTLRAELNDRLLTLPDLSFIPESMLLRDAMANPSAYGRANQDRIRLAMETADLCIEPDDASIGPLQQRLQSEDPVLRYWAATAVACFDRLPTGLADRLKKIADDDPHVLVSARSAMCLAIHESQDPRPVFRKCLTRSDRWQALQILNMVVFCGDHLTTSFRIDPAEIELSFQPQKKGEVQRRLEYLATPFERLAD